MKKLVAAIALVIFAAGTASAGWLTTANDGTVTIDAGKVATGLTFNTKVSANVKLSYVADTGGGTYYSLASQHSSGTKSYGTSSGESRIFMADNGGVNSATGITPKEAPTTTTGIFDWTGWTPVK